MLSKTPLRVLIVEDSGDDLLLLLNDLKRGGFDVTYRQAQNAEELSEALRVESWQIVISDYSLPTFDARQALEIVRPTTIPFFVLSGTIGENIAAEMMRAGAQDYVMKGNTTRLIPAIYRELDEFKHRETLRTKLQQKEDQLRQAQKMEAIGRLAGGIAHDFNNFLAVVMMMTELATEKVLPDHPIRKDLKTIQDASVRAAALTRQLLTFSRRQPVTPLPLNINTAVTEMQDMLQRMVSAQIQLKTELADSLRSTLMDKTQFEQIIMNLVVNARDAMPDGGTITMTTSNIKIERPLITAFSDIAPGEYVLLSLADTGKGIEHRILSRIFEPFFTTKGEKGTGLGLATVFGIIQSSNGYVNVTSVLNQGTTFDIYLQVCEASTVPAAAKVMFPVLTRKATIMVVEDQAELREAMLTGIKDKGFHVLEASSGPQAIALAENYKEEIDLLVTDMAMPGMNGIQLIENILKVRPKIKVILMSGFLDQNLGQLSGPAEMVEFLQKPFSNKVMFEKIAAMLNSPAKN